MDNNLLSIPIKPHFGGNYRLEYDGKYVTLYGSDKNYEMFRHSEAQPVSYEEMVLIPCVIEVRNARPLIKEVTDKYIIIDLGVQDCINL